MQCLLLFSGNGFPMIINYCFLPRLLRDESKPMPWPLRLRLLYQIASAINSLHLLRPPLLHLDLKPGNVLLTDHLDARVGALWTDQSSSRTKLITSKSLAFSKLLYSVLLTMPFTGCRLRTVPSLYTDNPDNDPQTGRRHNDPYGPRVLRCRRKAYIKVRCL